MTELRTAIMMAIAASGRRILFAQVDERDAINLRQRFYRYCKRVRQDPQDPLNLLVDNLRFTIDSNGVIIKYEEPQLSLIEGDRENGQCKDTGTNGASVDNDDSSRESGGQPRRDSGPANGGSS